ncbi:Hpt domain-containing protein [Rheinheimera sp. 4Y26]|uniref:Hpt domain-containing protein n=1 Tax=Rheinheimera sp. 4Y26 TaxID=2977811 RepID=UPI0021B0F9AE|nr:Hpt domain-containing protein [Rheinheimera sp. 4Y26]MCT6698655.1 Hpt domain-containing protein [Rheinheimera sp. 4Y26]
MNNAKILIPLSKLPLLNIEAVSLIYGESDPELILETLQQFQTEAQGYVSQIALIWHTGAAEDVVRYVHSLKTMTAMVGAEKMSRVCRMLERQLRAKDVVEARRTYGLFEKVWLDTLQQLDLHLLTAQGDAADAQ